MGIEANRCADRERGVEVKIGVCGPEHLLEQTPEQLRHTLAGEIRISGQPEPTTFSNLIVSRLEARRCRNHTVLPAAAISIAALVERCHHLRRQTTTFGQDRAHHVVGQLGEGRNPAPLIGHAEELEQEELEIALRRQILKHRFLWMRERVLRAHDAEKASALIAMSVSAPASIAALCICARGKIRA